MDTVIGVCVAIQTSLVLFAWRRLGQRALGLIGFLLLVVTFFYHGVTEIAQVVFPGYDLYREVAEPDSVRNWLLVITAAMVLFTTTYLARMGKYGQISSKNQLEGLITELRSSPLLRTPVLLAIGLPGFFITILGAQAEPGSNESAGAGLVYQFVPFLLVLAFATYSVKTHGRRFVPMLCIFALLLIATGSRTTVLIPIVLAASAMARYGIRLKARAVWSSVAIIVCGAGAITMSRNEYGRFNSGEGFGTRISTIASSVAESQSVTQASLLGDFVYRFDGNSFGAYIMTARDEGFGVTGLDQLSTTISYLIPSFINQRKLTLDAYLRNEEGYAVQFYGFDPTIDYASDLWTLLLAYVGPWALVVVAGILGWAVASIDLWLGTSTQLTAYLVGILLSMIPVNLEQGVAYIFYILRGLPVILGAAFLIRRTWRSKKPSGPQRLGGREYIAVSVQR